MREHSGTHPFTYGGVVDLESFQACIEEVKKEAEVSTKNPYLHEVLGEIVSSQHPTPLQKFVGDFCCTNFGGFCRIWRIFLGTFPHKK